MTTSLAARVAALERRQTRRGLRDAVARLFAEDASLAAEGIDPEDVLAEAERLITWRNAPNMQAMIAGLRAAEAGRAGGENRSG